MKRILLILFFVLLPSLGFAADTKPQDELDIVAPTSDDLWHIVDNPLVTPVDKKVTAAQMQTFVLSGNAATSSALAANGANCAAGSYPLGVDASGAVESCTDATTEIDSSVSTHAALTATHGVAGAIVGTTDTQTLTNKTITDSTFTFQDDLDNTKKGAFQFSGVTTATTRTYTWPDANGTVALTTSNVATSSALAANGANCAAGSYPLGVDASGAVESCTDATTEIDSAISTHNAANTHVDHTTVTLTAGAGLGGGGDISANRTFTTASQEANFIADGGVTSLTCGAAAQGKMQVMDDGTIQACDGATTSALQSFAPGAHTTDTTLSQEQVEDFAGALVGDGTGVRTGISVTYQDTTGDVDIVVDHDAASNFVANEHINHTSVTLTAGAGLGGGGDISANRTFTTASQEANFIADGGAVSLTCGASNQGKMQVMDDGTAEYCDGATTSVLRTIPAQHKRGFVRDLVAAATDVAVATTVAGDFRLPFSGTIDSVGCYVSTAGTTGTMTVDIHLNGTTIMTTSKITIDSAEKSSETAATAPALTTTSYPADGILTFDIDAIQTTAAKGVACWMDLLQ